MPLTFPAHQAIVLPLKIRLGDRIDGVALLVGAAAPDLHYAFESDRPFTHSLAGVLFVSVPMSVAYSRVLRLYAVPGLFSSFPTVFGADMSALSKIIRRKTSLVAAASSALIGAVSHIAWDSITHPYSAAAQRLGLDSTVGANALTVAEILQGASHLLGSIATLWMLYALCRKCGDTAQSFSPGQPVVLLAWMAVSFIATIPLAMLAGERYLFIFGGCLTVTFLVLGTLVNHRAHARSV